MLERDIEIGGHSFHVRFSYRASLLFEDTLKTYERVAIDHPTMLFYCAVKAGQIFKGVQFEMDYEQFLDWLDGYPEARTVVLNLATEYMSKIASEQKKK